MGVWRWEAEAGWSTLGEECCWQGVRIKKGADLTGEPEIWQAAFCFWSSGRVRRRCSAVCFVSGRCHYFFQQFFDRPWSETAGTPPSSNTQHQVNHTAHVWLNWPVSVADRELQPLPPHNNPEDSGWKQIGANDWNWYQRRSHQWQNWCFGCRLFPLWLKQTIVLNNSVQFLILHNRRTNYYTHSMLCRPTNHLPQFVFMRYQLLWKNKQNNQTNKTKSLWRWAAWVILE